MSKIVERVWDTAPTEKEAYDLLSAIDRDDTAATYGVFNIRSVDERIRPRTTNAWVILERRPEA